MYPSTLPFERTPAERDDQQLSWDRDDQAFFAAGACHVLAFAFAQRRGDDNFDIIYIRPVNYDRGHHVYVTDGTRAFDFYGWTPEAELLRVTKAKYGEVLPGWDYEPVPVRTSIELFCGQNNHRRPDQFAQSPWPRALAYIDRLEVRSG